MDVHIFKLCKSWMSKIWKHGRHCFHCCKTWTFESLSHVVQFEPVTSRVISTLTLVGVRPSMDPQSSILNLQILLGDIDNIDEDLSQEPDHQNNDGDFLRWSQTTRTTMEFCHWSPANRTILLKICCRAGTFPEFPCHPPLFSYQRRVWGACPQELNRYIKVYQGISFTFLGGKPPRPPSLNHDLSLMIFTKFPLAGEFWKCTIAGAPPPGRWWGFFVPGVRAPGWYWRRCVAGAPPAGRHSWRRLKLGLEIEPSPDIFKFWDFYTKISDTHPYIFHSLLFLSQIWWHLHTIFLLICSGGQIFQALSVGNNFLVLKVGVKEWEGSLSYLLLLFHYVSMFSLSRHTIEKLSLFCNLMTYSHGNWTKFKSLLFRKQQ